MLFVLYVHGGYELPIVEELSRKNISAYCPRQMKAERHHGKWQYVERIIFTRYVFVDVPELTAKIWHSVIKCGGAIRFVSLCPVPPDEEEYIGRLCNNGDCVGVSRGYVSDGVLHITSGFLLEREHEIVKFNRRGKRASADVCIYGKMHRVVFSVEFDDPPVLP